MPAPASKASELYKKLIQDGYTAENIGSEEEFTKKATTKEGASKLHSVLLSEGYTTDNLGDVNEFTTKLISASPDKKKVSTTEQSALSEGLQDGGLESTTSTTKQPEEPKGITIGETQGGTFRTKDFPAEPSPDKSYYRVDYTDSKTGKPASKWFENEKDSRYFFENEATQLVSPSGVQGYYEKLPKGAVVEKVQIPVTNPIDLSFKINELSQKRIPTGVSSPTGVTGVTPIDLTTYKKDEQAVAEAKTIKSDLAAQGYDADKIYDDFKDINPSLLFDENKKSIIENYKNNPNQYEKDIAVLKFTSQLSQALYNMPKDEREDPLHGNLQEIEFLQGKGYDELRKNAQDITQRIRYNAGDDFSNDLLKNAAIIQADNYGRAIINNEEAIKNDARSKYLNANQIGALQYLEDTNPDIAKGYNILMIEPSLIKKGSYEEAGWQEKAFALESIGLQLQKNSLKIILDLPDVIDRIGIEQAADYAKKSEEIDKQIQGLYSKYPQAAIRESVEAAMDLTDNIPSIGWANKPFISAGNAIYNTLTGVYEFASEPFRNDEESKIYQLDLIGRDIERTPSQYTLKSQQIKQTYDWKLSPELQKKYNDIMNDDSLSINDKTNAVYILLKNNPNGYARIPVHNNKLNISPASIYHSVTDLAATLVPYMALEVATGGGATAGLLRKISASFISAAATGFHDNYLQAIKDGSPNPYRQAIITTSIMSAAMAGAGTPATIKAMLGTKSAVGEVISKLTDDEIYNVLNKIKDGSLKNKIIDFGETIGKDTYKSIVEGAKGGAKFELAMAAAKKLDAETKGQEVSNEELFTDALIGILNFTIFGGVTGAAKSSYKSISNIQGDALLKASQNPTLYLQQAQKQLADNLLTKKEYDQIKDNIEAASRVTDNIRYVDENGNELSQENKAKLLAAKIQQYKLREQANGDIPTKLREKIDNEINEVEKDVEKIQKAEVPVPTEVIPEIKATADSLKDIISKGGEDAAQAQSKLDLLQKDPVAFFEKEKANYLNSVKSLETETSKSAIDSTIKYYDELITKIKAYDTKNIEGLPGEVGVGEKPVEAKPVEVGGTQETGGGGVLQENVPSGEGKVAEVPQGEVNALKDVSTTAKALQDFKDTEIGDIAKPISESARDEYYNLSKEASNITGKNVIGANEISEAYHKAKAENTNPEFVKSVEDLLSKKAENVPTAREEVSGAVQPTPEIPKGQKVEGRVQPGAEPVSTRGTEAETPVLTPKEGDIVELPSQVKGGIPRKMIFSEGEWKQQVGGKPIGVGENIQKQAQNQFTKRVPVKTIPSDLVNVLAAPYYDTKIKTIEDAKNLRESEGYKNHIKTINDIAQKMGLEVDSIDETIGGFVNESGDKITEISNRVKLKTTDLKKAEEFAAIIGALTHQTQESTIAARYVEHGSSKAVGIEVELKIDNIPGTLDALKEAGINDFELNESTNTVKIIDFSKGEDKDFSDKMHKFADILDAKNINYATEHHAIESTYIDPAKSSELLREAEIKAQQQQGGTDLYNIFKSAREKREAFIAEKSEANKIIENNKTLAESIRKLKIDLSKLSEGGLQSNIAGLPISVYNTIVETIAKSVELGTSLSKAIKDAVKQYELNKNKDFNLDEFTDSILNKISNENVNKNPVFFRNAKEFANKSEFDNKIQFKKGLQDLLQNHIKELKKIYGKDFDPSLYDEKTKKYLSDVLTQEAYDAVSKHPEAIGWYDEKTQSALDVVSAIHPEIATDKESRGAFILPLAIMSNGNKVDYNFDLAEKQYRYFKENGRFNPNGEFGAQQVGIKKSLMLINSLLDNGLTMNDINEFLTSKYKAKDLKVRIDGKLKDLATGELADENVYGATILGAKIGNGFYMNLWGEFDQLTMDRWFMRTWGRLTGTLIETDPKIISNNKERVKNALAEIKKDKQAYNILKESVGSISDLSLTDLSNLIEKKSADKELRAKLESNSKTKELKLAANSLAKNLRGEKEAPANGNERKYIRDVFNDVKKRLKEEKNIDITMADLQAALWYPEKILYESFKKGETFEGAAEGYTEDSAPDYLNAAKKLAKKNQVTDEQINQALSTGRKRIGEFERESDISSGEAISANDKEILARVKTAIGETPIESKEKVKKVADNLRKAKIKLGDGGLQSNIAGLPIAIYNAVIETIATSIEKGATLAEAISNAIKEYKLNENKEFDENVLLNKIKSLTETPVQENPFENIPKTQVARDKYFDTTFGENADKAREIYNQGGTPAEMLAKMQEAGLEPPVPPTEVKTEAAAPQPEKVGITKADIKELAIKYDLEIAERREAISDAEIETMAKELISNGYDVNKLVKESLEPEKRPLTDIEANILAEVAADMKAKIDKNSSDADIAKYRDVLSALNKGISENARGLRMAKVKKNVVESIADVMADMMIDMKQDELTTEQRKEAEKRFNDLKDALDKETELRKQAEQEIDRLNAELEIKKQKARAENKPKKSKQDYASERKAIIQSIKDKWNKASKGEGGLTMAVVPYQSQLMAIAPDVAKLVKSYLEQGAATTLEEVRALLKKDIQDVGIDVKDEDVIELIAGNYNKKKPTKNQYAKKLYELKQEEKLLLQIEALERGEEPTTEKKRIEKNQKLKELRDKIKELTGKEVPKREKKEKTEKTEDEKFEQALNARIKANQKKQSEIQDKINRGDFSPEVKKQSILENTELQKNNKALYDSYLKSVLDKDEALLEYEKARVADKMKNRGKVEKLADGVDTLLTTSKGTVAMFDQSVFLVQMLPFAYSHPFKLVQFAARAMKDFANKKSFDEKMAVLHSSGLWDLIEKSGLAIYEPKTAKIELRNELHGGDKNIWNKDMKVGGYNISPGQAFERATSSALNNARLYLFMNRVQDLNNAGKTFENAPEEFKAAARFANEFTGHGKVQEDIAKSTNLLNKFIWSPKMFASTFNILGLGDIARPVATVNAIARRLGITKKESSKYKGFYTSLTPEQGKFAVKELTRFILTGITIMYTTKLISMLSGDDDDKVKVDMNPTSSNFANMNIDGKNIAVFGRFASAVRTICQALLSEKTTSTGETKALGEGYGNKTSGEVVFGSFVRGKMTPASGLAYDFFLNNRKNYYTQEKLTASEIAKQSFIPMSARDIIKDFDRDGALIGTLETIAKLYGTSIRDERDFIKKEKPTFTELEMKDEKDKKAFDLLKKYGVPVPTFEDRKRYRIKVDDKHPEAGKTKDGKPYALYSEDEFKMYNDFKKDYIIKALKILNRLDSSGEVKLTKEIIEEKLKSVETQASKVAKNKMIAKKIIPGVDEEESDTDIIIGEEFAELYNEENPEQ